MEVSLNGANLWFNIISFNSWLIMVAAMLLERLFQVRPQSGFVLNEYFSHSHTSYLLMTQMNVWFTNINGL